jgi:hypothetical protein
VTEKDLDGSRVRALFGEVGGKAVTETVGACFDTHTEVFTIPFDFHLDVVRGDVLLHIGRIQTALGHEDVWVLVVTDFEVITDVALSASGEVDEAV